MGLETSDSIASYIGTQWLFTSKIESLDNELKQYQNALTRAVNHIRYKLPDEPIPDFLQDTDKLRSHR